MPHIPSKIQADTDTELHNRFEVIDLSQALNSVWPKTEDTRRWRFYSRVEGETLR